MRDTYSLTTAEIQKTIATLKKELESYHGEKLSRVESELRNCFVLQTLNKQGVPLQLDGTENFLIQVTSMETGLFSPSFTAEDITKTSTIRCLLSYRRFG